MNTSKIIFTLIALFTSAAAFAGTPPPTPVPFDPVSALVLGAGGVYIGKKLLKKSNTSE